MNANNGIAKFVCIIKFKGFPPPADLPKAQPLRQLADRNDRRVIIVMSAIAAISTETKQDHKSTKVDEI